MGNKVLWFEGAGCVERGNVENCRIRTAFTNDEGSILYLELSGMEVTKHTSDTLKNFRNVGFIDHCHYIRIGNGDRDGSLHDCERKVHFEYCKKGILEFVNEYLRCSFDEIRVTDMFYGYHVHRHPAVNGMRYNIMEDFVFDEEKAAAARNAFNAIDMDIRSRLGERYSKITLSSIGSDSITVRCYASAESMRKHGMNPEQREIEVKFHKR